MIFDNIIPYIATHHLVFGFLATGIVMVNLGQHMVALLHGKIAPHLFSWIVWAVSGVIFAYSQIVAGAGAGMWGTAMGALLSCCIVALILWRRLPLQATVFDWVLFALTLAAIPLWHFTKNEFYAVLVCTAVNIGGYYFSLKNILRNPASERAGFYGTQVLRWCITLLALQAHNPSTVLYPVISILLNGTGFVLVLMGRTRLARLAAGK